MTNVSKHGIERIKGAPHPAGGPYLPSFGKCGVLRSLALSVVLVLLVLTASCGYHTAGATTALPPDVKVLAIPSFQNQTHTYHLETGLTGAVIREFNTRTHYRIIQTAGSEQADATLQGTVVSAQVAPVAYDSVTGRAATGLATIVIKVTLTARDGRVLYSNPNYTFRDQYQISNELSSFFEEEGPALDRLQRDFSRTLVSDILEAF
jgi:outer membrane lipopolysaccharide assembly protein LptE/RlpB